MPKNVTVEVGDKMCLGFRGSDGRKYNAQDHKVEMPENEAKRILGVKDPDVRRYSKSWAVGIDLKALEAARKAREENQE